MNVFELSGDPDEQFNHGAEQATRCDLHDVV